MKITDILNEINYGDYARKARMSKALAQMNKGFGRDNPDTVAKADQTIAKREKGLARHKVRVDKYWADRDAKEKAEREQAMRDKYAGVDIDAEIEKLKPALQRAYNDYQYGARNTWSQGRDEYQRLQARIQELERAKKFLGGETESASGGATASGAVASGRGKGRPDSIVV